MGTSDRAAQLVALRTLTLASGQFAITWFGQSSFAIRANDCLLLIDPFLSDHPERVVPPPFSGHQATDVDAVLCTHEHLDHFDAAAVKDIAAASPQARIVVPRPMVPLVTQLGIETSRVVGAQPGDTIRFDGVTVEPVPAMHGQEVEDAYTFGQPQSDGLYRFLGYIIESGGTRLYHAGDTVVYPDMTDHLSAAHIDVALLPINGRDPEREAHGLVGNMDYREAVKLAAAVDADVLMPMHWDMFPSNPGFPGRVVDLVAEEYPCLTVVCPARGRPWIYTGATARQ